FEPFSNTVERFVHLDSSSLNAPSFENDSFVNETFPYQSFTTISVQATTPLNENYMSFNFDGTLTNTIYAGATTHPIYFTNLGDVPPQDTRFYVKDLYVPAPTVNAP